MPTPRQMLAVAVVNGRIYAIGGVTIGFSNANHAVVEAYDPKTDTWSTKSPMPTPRCCMATTVIDGLIHVAGGTRFIGHGGVETPGALEVYDPMNDSWITKSPMPTGRGSATGSVLDGKLYVAGGILAPLYVDLIQPTVERYDPKTDSWSSAPTMPTARAFAGSGTVGATLYVVGGLGPNDSENPHGRTLGINEAFSPFLAVSIDIKPGDAANTINLRSAGTVPVAILGSATFDPMTVDPATVTLAGAPVASNPRGRARTAQGDFNHDGYLDLLLHFRVHDLQLTPRDTEAVLYGTTVSGQRIRGADSVRIVRALPGGRTVRVQAPAPRNSERARAASARRVYSVQ